MIIRKLEALFSLNIDAAKFKQATSQLDKLAGKAESVMKAMAGFFAVQALQNFVTQTASSMAEVGKSAGYLGIATDALQELRFAAEKSGVSFDGINDALKELQIRAVDAKSGQGEAAEAFKMLGLSSTDAAGKIREPLELLDAVANGIKSLPQSQQLWVGDAIFGDEGSTVITMLKDGSAGLQNMRNEARALGIVMGTGSIKTATKFSQALKNLQMVSQGIGRTIAEVMLPPLTWLMEKFTAMSVAFNQLQSRASLVRMPLILLSSALTALAVKSLIAFAPMLLMVGLVGSGLAAIIATIDDLWVAFKGGDSAFLSLHNNARAFFEPIEQWVLDIPKKLVAMLTDLASKVPAMLTNLMPDFLKNGFNAVVEHTMPKNLSGPMFQPPPQSFAPVPNMRHENRVNTNNNVSVSVNVKSQADPREIGGEVSKAVRKELERERFNAFMGVTQYAG